MRATARAGWLSATATAIVLALVTAGGGSAIASPHAAAAGSDLKCAKTARIVAHHGHGSITIYGVQYPSGAPFHGTKITRLHAYQVEGERITLSFGTDRYMLNDGSIFALSCSGDAAGDPAVMPSLSVLRGTIRVHTTAARHGTVFTEEALLGPVAGHPHAMTYTVTRTPKKKHLSLTDLENWYVGYSNQPAGTSAVTTTSKPNLNVTPYVGTHHGSCRSVRSAKLVTKGKFGHGKAVYNF